MYVHHQATIFATLLIIQSALGKEHGRLDKKRNLRARRPKKDKLAKTQRSTSILAKSMPEPWQNRIVGGTDAAAGAFPYFVRGRGCGASLVAPDVVMSAAHCEGAFDGTVRIGSIFAFEGGQEVATIKEQELLHPSYANLNNDIMLIKLKEEVSFPPVSINFNDTNPVEGSNAVLTVIGFGATSEGGSGSTRLKEVNVNYVDADQCDEMYGGRGSIKRDTMLCAGVPEGGKDSCQGDSGGPIMDASGSQVGVVSFGDGCARAGKPGVYARTSGFDMWLKENICRLATTKPGFCNSIPDSPNSPADGPNMGTEINPADENAGTTGSMMNIRVKVDHDDYPEETEWSVMDSSNNMIMHQNAGDVLEWGAVKEQSANVPPGTFKFTMTDTESDGICCDYGQGKVEVFVDEKRVKSFSGDFGESLSFSFDTNAMEDDQTDNGQEIDMKVKYMVEVQYDQYPRETGFWLRDNTEDRIIFRRDVGSEITQGKLCSREVNLVPGNSYLLAMRDSYGDGLEQPGHVEVYAMFDGKKRVLLRDNGDFGSGRNNHFTVPSNLGRGGPIEKMKRDSSPSCSDTDDLFVVNDKVGEQSCHWLSDNLDKFGYLCEFVHPASACPQTCGHCALFSNAVV